MPRTPSALTTTNSNSSAGRARKPKPRSPFPVSPDGPEKNNFGLPPKKTRGASVPLEQVVITQIEDGTSPASIFVDWDSEEGAAAYQIEWFTDSALTQQVGNAAVSESEYEIAGLIAGQQYWVRVRAIRGNESGQWSDPATSIANI